MYHRYYPEMRLGFTQKLEQTQYSAALAVSGAWRGTHRQRLYDELGWETLYSRRWYRRLCHFFNLKNNQSPEYLFNQIPDERRLRILQKEFFLLWCTDVERNPNTNKNEFHDYHVQKEIKGIPAKLAFPPEARSLGRPALYLKLQFNVNFLFFVSQLADRVSV